MTGLTAPSDLPTWYDGPRDFAYDSKSPVKIKMDCSRTPDFRFPLIDPMAIVVTLPGDRLTGVRIGGNNRVAGEKTELLASGITENLR